MDAQHQTNHRQHYSVWYYIIPPCVLAAVTALVYYPSLHYAFQFDDIANITKHFNIRHHTFMELFFSGPRWISYWINAIHYSIGRFDPFSYRVGNVMFHTTAGLLVFFNIFMMLTGLNKKNFFKTYAFSIACTSAVLFLLHPVQTQTVSYVIQGELEGLAALFILAMVAAFLILNQTRSLVVRYMSAVALAVLAAFSTGTKEIAIISPALLLLIDWFFVAQGDFNSLRKRWWQHALVATIVIAVYVYYLGMPFFTEILGLKRISKNNIGNVITHNPSAMITPASFFISQFKVVLHYLWMFIWPFNISVEYDWVLSRSFVAPDCIIPFAILVIMFYGIFLLLRKDPAHTGAFGLVWFFVAIAPRSSIIPSPELLVDYKTYTASFGWLFLLAVCLVKGAQLLWHAYLGAREQAQIALLLLPVVVAVPLGLCTLQRNTVWRSGTEFWANIIRNAPGKARAYNNYGVELSQNLKQYKEAIPYFKKAIAMDRNYPDPCNNLAVAYSVTGDVDKAIDALKQGIRINPYYPEGYNNLASFLIQKNRLDEAEKALQTALQMRPYYGKAYFNLGRLYLQRNENERAWECFKNCCTKGDLDDAFGFGMYAKVSVMVQKYDDAIFAYKKVLEFNPGDTESEVGLANTYLLAGQPTQAIELYERALSKVPNEAQVIYALAEAYFRAHDPQKALHYFKRVEPHSERFPQVGLRIAACYEQAGDIKRALEYARATANNPAMPKELQAHAQQAIAGLTRQHGAAA